LLLFTEVTSEADLPQLWPDLAASPARHRRWILDEAVINRALETSAATSVPPIITKITYELTLQCKFGSSDLNNPAEGLHPGQVAHKACGVGAAAQAQAEAYDLTMNRITSPTVAEQAALTTTAAPPPHDTFALDGTVRSLSVVLDVILGVNHRLSLHYREAFLKSAWPRALAAFNSYNAASPNSSAAALILRKLQLIFVTFFNGIRLGQPPPPLPPFGDLIIVMLENNYNTLPPLPPRFFPASTPITTPATEPTLAAPKPAALPTPSTARGNGQRTMGNKVSNPNVSATWKDKFEACGRSLRDVRDGAPPLPLCLSYHLRGGCFDNCSRTASHKPLSATERSTLTDFVAAHLIPATGGPL
jgi:hypothetical protein